VTNAHGSVTSAPAILTVEFTTPPSFDAALTWSDGTVTGTLSGLAGQTFIEASSNLVDWMAVTNVVLTNSPTWFTDPTSTNHPQRFYRAVVQ
jgi:hypothetical protein